MLTVCLSFDVDATSLWLHTDSPSVRSRGEFANVAVPRLLDLLSDRDLLATFFVPGHTADNHTEAVKAIAGAGHEIGHHGYLHENPALCDEQAEREALERGFDALERTVGVRPTGYRAPGWFTSTRTNDLLVEYGFAYDSSLMADDFTPYLACPGLVELPIYWGLDDFVMAEFIPGKLEGLRPPSHILEIWRGDFDFAVRSVPDGVFTLVMHPQVIGRGHRMLMLERFLDHVADHDVRFSQMHEAAAASVG